MWGKGRIRDGKETYGVSSEVVSHVDSRFVVYENRHVIFNCDIVSKDVHISVIPVYLMSILANVGNEM